MNKDLDFAWRTGNFNYLGREYSPYRLQENFNQITCMMQTIEVRFQKIEKFLLLEKLSDGELDKIVDEYKLRDK